MCQNCKSSSLGIERQAELDTAITECQRVNINPATSGFIARHAYRGHTPFTDKQKAALARYNTAQSLMKSLHGDYVFERARAAAEQRLERISAGRQRDYLQEYAVAFDANDDAAQAALLRIAETDHGLNVAIDTLHAKFDGVRTMCEHLQAIRGNS